MQQTRIELDAALAALSGRLADIIAEHGAENALARFSVETQAMTADLPAEDTSYVFHRISCMLSGAGLIPGQDEGEQCRIGD